MKHVIERSKGIINVSKRASIIVFAFISTVTASAAATATATGRRRNGVGVVARQQ
jgi:hypothetical protein